MQTTLKSPVAFAGHGLHSGAPVTMTVHPASAEHGIWFRRTDAVAGDPMIPALWDAVGATALCTKLVNGAGNAVSTVEHVMAALAGCGIHNALIEIDGPEPPILDGSAADFARAFLARGVRVLDAPLYAFEVTLPVEVRRGEAFARLDPAPALEIDFTIDFPDEAIGRQSRRMSMANGAFLRDLADSRTFCRLAEIDDMHAQGLALGGTLDNAVVVDGARVLTPGGMRHDDEAVRHKMLDALGDLALAGVPILGRYTGHRAGHGLTNAVLRQLFATPGAVRLRLCTPEIAASLPGAGIGRDDLAAIAA